MAQLSTLGCIARLAQNTNMEDTNQPKRGRPLVDDTAADGHIHLRVTMERKNSYVHAARRKQQKLSEWMTQVCDKAAAIED